MAGMVLYYCETLNPRKACAAARYLGVDVDFVWIDLAAGEQRTPAFLALNPNGKVPVLKYGQGETLWEANAIMCFLSDSIGSDFWPHDARQMDVMRWLSWDASHFTLHGATLWFENEVKPLFGQSPDADTVADAGRKLQDHARILDDHLAGRKYVVGERASVADFALAAALPYAASSDLPIGGFTNLMRWHDRLNEIEAWRQPFPDRHP